MTELVSQILPMKYRLLAKEERLTKLYSAGVPTDENTAEQDIQFFDWDALMTDFDWSFMPDITPSLNV